MGTLDKEIRVIAVRGERGTDGTNGVDGQDGQDGKSSYDLAIENELFSGTLAEWINTFATPENYITRSEFKKVTQAQYDALKLAGELIPNCYYLIIDSTDAEDFEQLKTDVSGLDDDVNNPTTGLKTRVSANETDISKKLNETYEDDDEDIFQEIRNNSLGLYLKNNNTVSDRSGEIELTRGTVVLTANGNDGINWVRLTISDNDIRIERVGEDIDDERSLFEAITTIPIQNNEAIITQAGLYKVTCYKNSSTSLKYTVMISADDLSGNMYMAGIKNGETAEIRISSLNNVYSINTTDTSWIIYDVKLIVKY